MRRISVTAALLASVLAIAGCNRGAAPANNAAAAKPEAANTAAPAPEPAAPAGNEATEGAEGAAPTAEVEGAARQNFAVVNATGHVVVTLNVSPANENEWGPDILGQQVLASGETAQVTFQRGTEQCLWDIRATYDDGDTTDERGINLCQVATVRLTP